MAQIKKSQEPIILLLLLIILIIISYTGVTESISVVKYHLHWDIGKLIENYNLFLYAPKDFFLNTLPLHQGDGQAGWRTIFYLLPLFICIKLFGGLSLKAVYLFTITTSIFFLLFFYLWVKKFWSKKVAFFATFFLGYSAIFQEIARSGSYISFSILFAIILIFYSYNCLNNGKILSYFFLGILTGIAMYGYGTLRCLFLVVCICIMFERSCFSRKRLALFFIGLILVILPGIILTINKLNPEYSNLHSLFFDEELFTVGRFPLSELKQNVVCFLNRISGGPQIILPIITNNFHAHFLNRLLIAPFVIGVIAGLKRKNDYKHLLLILSLAIYLTPLITTNSGYSQARRSLLYIIPTYLFIGLGVDKAIVFINSLSSIFFKRALQLFLLSGIIFIAISEVFYTNKYIINANRDLGLLKFADNIKKFETGENLYYLETINTMSVYVYTNEGIILEVALMSGKDTHPNVVIIKDLNEIPRQLKSFYLVKSPYISQQEYGGLCKKYFMNYKLLCASPVLNYLNYSDRGLQSKFPEDMFFNLYFIVRQSS